MPVEIVVVPCLRDNYAYLLREDDGPATLIDAPEAGPIDAALDARGWTLGTILITHHHDDHIAGVEALRTRHGATVVGAAADRARLPRLDRAVVEGDVVGAGALAARVVDVPGHTRGHVAFHVPGAEALFSADSLMVMGCGRLFEGTAEEMWASLSKLVALPDATRVYSGHEYTEGNARFALSLEPERPETRARAEAIAAARRAGRHTMGPTLAEERASNPFLRAGDAALKAALGLAGAPDAAVFAEIRRRKDVF
jgi:hydroxyacylglutathione hydrolase